MIETIGPRLQYLARPLRWPAAEWWLLLLAQVELARAARDLRVRPTGQLLRTADASATPVGGATARLEAIARAVSRAARLGLVRSTCLIRAMAMERMIARFAPGIAVVRVGVAREGGQLLAHAWIEAGGRVIGDDPRAVQRFVRLSDFAVLAGQ